MTLLPNITIGEKYAPAMSIGNQAEADAYFEQLVQHGMSFGKTREEAEADERAGLGYYAGYYDTHTRVRVESLFKCEHPIFGSMAKNGEPSMAEALKKGLEFGKKANADGKGENDVNS
jgi:hypothetical protein